MSANGKPHPLWQGISGTNLFEYLKSGENAEDVRRYFEALYDSLGRINLIDKHFDRDFRNHVPQRWWELFIGNWLLSQPDCPAWKANSEGPDFVMDLGSNNFWIECVVPWPKNDDRRIDSTKPHRGGIVNSNDYILAITGAVQKKSLQLLKSASSSDFCIIAINLSTGIDVDIAESNDPSLLFQALLGIGPNEYRIPVLDGEANLDEISEVHTFRKTIKNANDALVSVRGFLDGLFPAVSGILYSIHRYVNCPNPQTTELIFLHNPTATNPLPRGTFTRVKEYAVEDGCLVLITDPKHGSGGRNE
jgi:hypothetical protein